MSLTVNSVKPLNIPYWTWVEDFNEDGGNDVFIFNNNNVLESYYYKTINCNSAVKPVINTSKMTYCANETLKLSIINNASGDVYKWYFGKQIDSSNVSTKSFSDSGKLVIIKTDATGCTTKSDTLTLTKLASVSTPNITRDGSNLVSSSPSGNQWFLDGIKLVGEIDSKIKASSTGIYTVKTVDANGCSSDASKGEYGLITGNTVFETSTTVQPNPFSRQIQVTLPVEIGTKAEMQVFDFQGKQHVGVRVVRSGEIVDLSQLSPGIYFLRLESSDHTKLITRKIVKIP
jgi:hypothetical protein